jgi:selenocysteine lyase/cysteine desulfurase
MSNIIHLNNAGAALQPEPVLHAVIAYLHLEAEMGGYEAADQQAEAIAGFYTSVAELIGAKARNIAFATSATDAYARALSSIHWQKGDILLTTENDYVSNQIAFLALQDRYDIRLLRARDTSEGGVDVADFEALIKAYQPRLAAVTHVPTNSGLIQDVISIGQICRTHEVLYLVDGCQSAGQMVLDMDQIGCDFFSATMRKFMRGPRGSGFLFVSDRVLEAGLMMDLPDMKGANWTAPDQYEAVPDARRFEYWERPPALMLGAKAAADYALAQGMARIQNAVFDIAAYTRQQLATLPNVKVLDHGAQLSGIVTAHAPHWEADQLMDTLRQARINCRISNIFSAQIDFRRKGVSWALRVSPHYYNTKEEIDQLIEVLGKVKP